MTEDGQPENASKIQNEEHQHDATAKRTILVASDGSLISTTEPLPVNILGATLSASISVELDKDDDSVTTWQPTANNHHVLASDGAGSLGSTEGTFVVTTATPTILYSATTDRAGFFVQNLGDNDIYLGFTNALTTTSNLFAKLTSGESGDWSFTNTIYVIASTANSTLSHGGT